MSRTLVNRATTDDQKPVSGLILKELADKTLESIIECQNIQTMLLAKLAKPSPDVKLKVLTCIKYLAQNGRDDFRIELQRNHTKIREHTTIRGVADPLRGELPFDKVRDMAKEAMNAVFNSTGRVQEKSTANRMTGYGGDGQSFESSSSSSSKMGSMSSERSDGKPQHDYGSGTFSSGSTGQSGRTMQGYGNYDPTKDKTFLEKMKEKVVKEQPPGPYKPYVKPAVYGEASFGGYGGGVDIAPATMDATRKKFGVGGDWGKEDAPASRITATATSMSGFGAASNKSFGPASTGVASQPVARNKNVQPTEFERKIIEDITAPTGVRVALSAGELAGFLRKCESLDTYMVVGLLNEKLMDANPAAQQKALHCLESLLSTERFAEDTEEFLSDHEETIASLLEHSNKAIRAKALKIMVQIGLREPENEKGFSESSNMSYQQQPQPQQSQQNGSVDLLNLNAVETTTSSLQNFNFLETPAPAAQPSAGFEFQQAPATKQPVDVFNFTTPTTNPPNASSAFNFTSSSNPAPNNASSNNAGFNFLSPQPVSTQTASSQSTSNNSGFNFTSSAQPAPASQVAAGFNFTSASQPAQTGNGNNAGFNFSSSTPATSSSIFPFESSAPPATTDFNFTNPTPVFHFANNTSAPAKSAVAPSSAPSASFSFVSSSAPAQGSADLQFLSDSGPASRPAVRDPVAELLLLGAKSGAPQFQQQQSQFQVFPQQQQFAQQQFGQQQFAQFPQQQHLYPLQQQQQQQMRNFPQLQPLQPLQPNRSTDSFFGVGMQGQTTPQKSGPRVDSFAFVKEEMSRN